MLDKALDMVRNLPSFSIKNKKRKTPETGLSPRFQRFQRVVEHSGIEPLTSTLPARFCEFCISVCKLKNGGLMRFFEVF